MNWTNVRLICQREVRDQLRDPRTIFTIVVMPLLLYPLLGMSLLQVTQFMKEHPTSVRIVGSAALPQDPPLLADEQFQLEFCPPQEQRLMKLSIAAASVQPDGADAVRAQARSLIQSGECDAVVYFPPGMAEVGSGSAGERVPPANEVQELAPRKSAAAVQSEILVNLANDKSRIALARIERVLTRWRKAIVRQNLLARGVPETATEPFEIASTDLSEEVHRRAAVWSKLLPFVLLVWALTGAFYPAIDLCAGEKERGTLETLLSSPADRREIVWGKLLTIMGFSAATALLNLASMGISAVLIVRQLGQLPDVGAHFDLGPPPLSAIGWLLLAVVPISALFSALALAIASFARSSKEGQYYLMPLLLITLPLMILPMLPSIELDLGNSLIPITGMLLWLRVCIEGEFLEAVRYALPVLGITAGCCWLAVRWAVWQFENESVLFRESERFSLGIWLRHLVRDSGDTPSAPQAMFCGLVVLLATFFAGLRASAPASWYDFARIVLATQVGLIATPALLMALVLTRNPRRTLLLRAPRWSTIPAALLLAIVLNPLVVTAAEFIRTTYPLAEDARRAIGTMMDTLNSAPLPYILLLVGVTPAICEELAFRGFILSGLRRMGSKWTAILVSSLLFGLTHGLLQQSLSAILIGIVIAYVAVQSDSLLPAAVLHCTHNSLSILAGRVTAQTLDAQPWLQWFFRPVGEDASLYAYHAPWLALSAAATIAIVWWFHRLSRAPGAAE